MALTNEKLTRNPRKYFSENFNPTNWDQIEAEYKKLLEMEIQSADRLIEFMERFSELYFITGDEMARRYIDMSCYADDKEKEKAFNSFYADIVSNMKKPAFELMRKFYDSPYRNDLDHAKYDHLNQLIAVDIELFREENTPLAQQVREIANQYGSMIGGITAEYDGKEHTLRQLSVYLKKQDRKVREEVFHIIHKKIAEKSEAFDELFDKMKDIRVQIAKNAGFDNFRDYVHRSNKRFSYTPEDLFRFHESVEKQVMPFIKELDEERKEKLGLDELRPWDTAVDLDGKILKPYKDTNELTEKSIRILSKIKPEFGRQLQLMKNTGFLDLDNRKGKAPGGYNYPFNEWGASFIFMNSVGLQDDVSTLLHEAGHALHASKMSNTRLDTYREHPSEVAELASMAMELLSMDYWDEFYSDEEDLKKAKREQLEGTLTFLPWCMVVDAFQQWIYLNPDHTPEQRSDYFMELRKRYDSIVNWDGFEAYQRNLWKRQLHIFETPFYYIEYGIAQLGALSIYRNYRENPEKAVEQYENFLSLLYTKPVDELYEAAGIKFDFSEEYIASLVDFVRDELKKLR